MAVLITTSVRIAEELQREPTVAATMHALADSIRACPEATQRRIAHAFFAAALYHVESEDSDDVNATVKVFRAVGEPERIERAIAAALASLQMDEGKTDADTSAPAPAYVPALDRHITRNARGGAGRRHR